MTGVPPPTVKPRPWIAIGAYGVLALGAVPLHYVSRALSDLPPEAWAGTTAIDDYFGPDVLFHAAAGAAAVLLATRDARAFKPAVFVGLWLVLRAVDHTWRWFNGREPGVFALVHWLIAAGGVVLVAYVHHLKLQEELKARGS